MQADVKHETDAWFSIIQAAVSVRLLSHALNTLHLKKGMPTLLIITWRRIIRF